jgi:hypothetical protein
MKKIFRTMLRAPADEGAPAATPPADAPPAETPPAEGDTPPADEEDKSPGSLLDDDTPPADKEEGDETPPAEPLTAEDIKFPEGVEPNAEALTGFLDLMNDPEISPAERAQKLIDLQLSIAEDAGKASQALWDKTQSDWQAEAQALPEIGGDQLPKTLANIKSGLDKLGATKETYAALNFTGAGNHPEIIRILSKATAHLIEGTPTKDGTAPAKGKLSQADRIYGQGKQE